MWAAVWYFVALMNFCGAGLEMFMGQSADSSLIVALCCLIIAKLDERD